MNPVDSEHFYFHSLKQALFLLHGTTRSFNDLSVEQQRNLWKSIHLSDRSNYELIACSFRPTALLDGSRSNPVRAVDSTVSELKYIPVRLICTDKPAVQRPVVIWRGSEDVSGSGRVERRLGEVLREDFADAAHNDSSHTLCCIVQGVEVPFDAPIYDLWRLMSHCDLFLYITLRTTD